MKNNKVQRATIRFVSKRIIRNCLVNGILLASFGQTNQVLATEQSNKVHFDIPSGNLANALLAYSEVTGIQLSYQQSLVSGLNSSSVTGDYTPEQALQKLLVGADIAYHYVDKDAIALAEAPKEKSNIVNTLKPVIVASTAMASPNDPFNKEYNVSNASSATKTDTPIHETPLSIQVVPKAVINDQQGIRVSDALRNVSGYFNSRGDQPLYDGAFLRGFQVGSRMYIDGFRDMGQSRSLANLERVEVVKGPAAALYGRLEPGGLINHVTKRPLFSPYYSVQQQFGSFDLYRTQVDATGPLGENRDLAYRVNFEYVDRNSYVDFVKNNRLLVAPSFTWKISDQTKIDFDYRYSENKGQPNFGIPAVGKRPANVPISRFIGDPSDSDSTTQHFAGIGLTHEFSDAWKLETKFAYNNAHLTFSDTSIDSFDEATGIAEMGYFNDSWRENSYQGVVNLTGKFSVANTEHTLVTGMDAFTISGEENGTYLSKSMGTTTFPADLNIYNPVYGVGPGVNLAVDGPNSPWYESQEWYGFYVQDDMKFLDDWHLLFGTRYDQANFTSSGSLNRANLTETNDGEFSPRVGLLYQPVSWLSMYANYVRAFNGQNTSKLAPGDKSQSQHSESYEGGLKGEWLDGRLSASLAYYDLTKTNMAINHPDLTLANQGYKTLAGKARSKGVEFDISGKVTENLSLIGTYSFTNTKFLLANANIQGNEFAGVPKHAGSLWSRYDFGALGVHGLWTGAGVFVAGQREGDNRNSFELPGYARLDAALGYSWNAGPSKVTFQFNVDNLLDKLYYSASGNNGSRTGILPGAPRTFLGSVRVEF
ncbi:TonB-dependent siderophore receptor [Methylomonas sp. TEB]|uniref:TonB-dependent siderophore receptor n=1 Tax=Methylomonas sp. TEB TaxID=3398229 RepID=UPI0039F58A4F